MSNTVGNQSMVVPPDPRLQELREQLAAAQRNEVEANETCDYWRERAERAEAQLGEAREEADRLRNGIRDLFEVHPSWRDKIVDEGILAFLAREGTPQP